MCAHTCNILRVLERRSILERSNRAWVAQDPHNARRAQHRNPSTPPAPLNVVHPMHVLQGMQINATFGSGLIKYAKQTHRELQVDELGGNIGTLCLAPCAQALWVMQLDVVLPTRCHSSQPSQ